MNLWAATTAPLDITSLASLPERADVFAGFRTCALDRPA